MMHFFYCGLIEDIINWIVAPVANALGSAVETIMRALLEQLTPFVVETYWNVMLAFLSRMMYRSFIAWATYLDIIESVFKLFAGVDKITYQGQSMTILDLFFAQKTISRSFYYLTFMSLIACFIFTIYGVARSALDFDFENKRPVGKVLGSFFKSAITFLIIPAMVIFALKLTSIVTVQTYEMTSTATKSNLSTTLFLVSSMNAAKDNDLNGNNASFTSAPRIYFTPDAPIGMARSFKNVDDVEKYFDFRKFDYWLAALTTLFLLFIYITVCFVFLQRTFELVLLYLISPIFVAAMPLDDGELFKKWREMFFGKLISGYGMMLTMNIYLLMIPVIMNIDFGITGSNVGSWLVKILFIVAGALAAKQSAHMLTGLFSQMAGQSEQQAAGFAANVTINMAKTAIKLGTGAVSLGVKGVMGLGGMMSGGGAPAGDAGGGGGGEGAGDAFTGTLGGSSGGGSRGGGLGGALGNSLGSVLGGGPGGSGNAGGGGSGADSSDQRQEIRTSPGFSSQLLTETYTSPSDDSSQKQQPKLYVVEEPEESDDDTAPLIIKKTGSSRKRKSGKTEIISSSYGDPDDFSQL